MTDLRKLMAIPGPKEEGYLERVLRYEELKTQAGPKGVWDVVEFIVDFMKDNDDREAARKIVMKASQEEINAVLEALSYGKPINPPNAAD